MGRIVVRSKEDRGGTKDLMDREIRERKGKGIEDENVRKDRNDR